MSCDAYGDDSIAIAWKYTNANSDVTDLVGTPGTYVPGDYKRPSTYTKTGAALADDGTYSCEVATIPTLKDSIPVDVYSK